MARKKVFVRETLAQLSERWCARNEFPSGLYLTMLNSKGRQKRNDTNINRRVLPEKADDKRRLSSALDELQKTLVTDTGQRNLTLALRKPNKMNIPRNTRISTIRNMDIEDEFPTPEVVDPGLKRGEREEQIELARNHVEGAILSCTEGEGLDEEAVAEGAIRAILELIDRHTLLKALDEVGVLKGR